MRIVPKPANSPAMSMPIQHQPKAEPICPPCPRFACQRIILLISNGFVYCQAPGEDKELLWVAGVKCEENRWYEAARRYIGEVMSLAESPDQTARRFLNMCIVKEESGDYKAAAESYSRVFAPPKEHGGTWSLLNNNLGHPLNLLSQHQGSSRTFYFEEKVSR